MGDRVAVVLGDVGDDDAALATCLEVDDVGKSYGGPPVFEGAGFDTTHLKLADVHVGLRNVQKAVEEYLWVADRYSADGFHDRAIAVLIKARRLNPMAV